MLRYSRIRPGVELEVYKGLFKAVQAQKDDASRLSQQHREAEAASSLVSVEHVYMSTA